MTTNNDALLHELYGRFQACPFEVLPQLEAGTILYNRSWSTFFFSVRRGPLAPCVYLGINSLYPFYGVDYANYEASKKAPFFEVHGGVTFSGSKIARIKDSQTISTMYDEFNHNYTDKLYVSNETSTGTFDHWIIGWDYAHYGDMMLYAGESNAVIEGMKGKKWDLKLILEDNIHIIESMIKMDSILTDHTKNKALLNIKDDDERIRYICRKKLREGR